MSRAHSFGVQTHFGQHRADQDALLDLIDRTGVGWIRDEVYWSEVEKTKGTFDFPPSYDGYLKAAQSRGIQVLLILDYANALYAASDKTAPTTEVERQAFGRYCTAVVSRYQPLGVTHFEIWNEPNASTFWRPQPDAGQYARLLETAWKACKSANPRATVIGCSTAGTDLDFIGRVFAAGGGAFMDAVSFHPYCQPLAPERKFSPDLSRAKGVARGKPLWITEFGYPTNAGPTGIDQESQANYLARAFLLARANRSVERVFWYDFQNDGEDPNEAEFNFGLVRKDRTLKPAYAACRTLASVVRDLVPMELRVVGNTYLLRFDDGPASPVAVWRSGGTETTEVPCPKGAYLIVERDGQSRAIESRGPVLQVAASERPRYVVPRASRGLVSTPSRV